MRCFVAIPLPGRLQAQLVDYQSDLKRHLGAGGLRWVRPEQVHLTLKFLGDLPETVLPDLKEALGRSTREVRSFDLRPSGLGVFPDGRRPRVIWIGLRGDLELLQQLQRKVEAATTRWVSSDPKPFHPHLTLARVKTPQRELGRIMDALPDTIMNQTLDPWPVHAIELMQSRLLPRGATYSVLGKWDLETRH